MFSRFASSADGRLLGSTSIHGLALILAVSKMLFRPRVRPGRTQGFGLPELAISWCLAVSHPALTDAFYRFQFHSRGGFALVLAVSKMPFRPRVWSGRTQGFGLPELAISPCLAVSHPAPTDAF